MKDYLFKRRGFLTKSTSVVLAALMAASVIGAGTVSAAGTAGDTSSGDADVKVLSGDSNYFGQYDVISSYTLSDEEIEIKGTEYTGIANSQDALKTVADRQGVLLGLSNDWIEWTFDVKTTGTVALELDYTAVTDRSTDIMVALSIDGKSPFTECASLYLPRLWKREYFEGENGLRFKTDSQGNEIASDPIQLEQWNKIFLEDSQGYYDEPYLFYLEAGKHTIRLSAVDSAVIIGGLKFYNKDYIPYKEYYNKYSSQIITDGETAYQQAELTEYTNSASINPTSDKLDAGTVPTDPVEVMLNTIGQTNWSSQGESISWKVDVPKAGMYKVAFRARQNVNSGLTSYRNLYVNGEIPFDEARNVPFKYSQGWTMYTLGGEEEMLLYLEPGDILTLTCSPGKATEVLRNISQAISELNHIYRKVIAITSVNPDTFQDYKIEKRIPNIEEDLSDIEKDLRDTYAELCDILGTDGSLASTLNYVADTIEKLAAKPYTIPEKLSSFKSGIETLASLTQSLSAQPLEIDYIAYLPTENDLPKVGVGFFKSLGFGFKQFIASFTTDYTMNDGHETEKTINVWVSTGRDQARILTNLITSDFIPKTGTGVELNMVDTGGTLVRAALAGKGPDVALMVGQGQPVELAARGAILDLTEYVTDDMYDDFHKSAWTPFYYQDKIYAFPETQAYQVVFYRTDIFEELGLTVPNTWDEFYEVMAVLHNNNLLIGLNEVDANNYGVSAGLGVFESLLLQRGLKSIYTPDLKKTMFDTEIAYQTFTDWSEFYTQYGVERELSFYTRFRSGEVPIAVSSFATAVQLQQTAPEIRGLWAMAPFLGTEKEDGTIDRSQTAGVTGCMVLKAAEERGVKEEAAQFLKWWVSADVQHKYGTSLETTLGAVGRYYSANLEAFEKSNWSTADMELIQSHRQYLVNFPTVVGSYAVQRDLTSALREVIAGTERPRRALMLYNTDINEEITRKRKEFGLET